MATADELGMASADETNDTSRLDANGCDPLRADEGSGREEYGFGREVYGLGREVHGCCREARKGWITSGRPYPNSLRGAPTTAYRQVEK